MALNAQLNVLFKLSLGKKIGILGVANVLLILGFFYLFISPSMGKVDSLEVTRSQIREKIQESRSIADDIPRFEREKKELEVSLMKALEQLPNKKEIPDLIDSISTAGMESGLKIDLFKPRPDVPRGFYAEVPVQMEVRGRYESIYHFTERVAGFSRIVNIEGMDLSVSGREDLGSMPMLKASFVATTFRFVPASQIKKGGK